MFNLNQALETLEHACEGEAELIAFTQPDLTRMIEAIKALPLSEQDAVRDRLDRVSTIIEGKMMIYAEELQALGGQIKKVAANNAATSAYRTAAVFHVKKDEDNA